MKMYKILIISFLTIFIVSCKSPVSTTVYNNIDGKVKNLKQIVKTISQKDFKKILDRNGKINILDCREKEKFDTACIPGAVNIPRGVLEFEISNKIQERRKTLYVYSDNEAKSILAAESLKLIKFSKVIVIENNWNTWKNSYPDYVQLEPNAGQIQETSIPVEEEGGCGG